MRIVACDDVQGRGGRRTSLPYSWSQRPRKPPPLFWRTQKNDRKPRLAAGREAAQISSGFWFRSLEQNHLGHTSCTDCEESSVAQNFDTCSQIGGPEQLSIAKGNVSSDPANPDILIRNVHMQDPGFRPPPQEGDLTQGLGWSSIISSQWVKKA